MLLIAMSGLVSANSMNNEFQTIQSESTESTNMTFQTVVNTLYAGQNINVGTLNISNDCQNLTVTYEMAGNWTLQETHLEIATSFESIPMTKSGNPVIGHFTYKNEELPEGSIIDTYVIPVNGKNGTVYIAAHAVVSNQNSDEGAWASGTQFPGDNWATYFTYDIINCAKEEIDQEDNEGDDGEDNEGNDGEDNEGGDGEDNEGNDGEDNEGNDGEDNEGNDGEDNEGNEGEDNEGDTNNGKKSGSSGSARVSEVSETTSEDNNAYMSTPQEEEPQPPVMSVAEPVHETKEQRILVLLAEKGSNLLWILIAMLLSGIWIMSGYGLTHP
jgi:predicted heme/steroid binding protein